MISNHLSKRFEIKKSDGKYEFYNPKRKKQTNRSRH